MLYTVSVIIPVYNAAQYLERCLNSVVGQTYANLEIILVDDGSTDTSADICCRYADSDSRIKVIHQPNAGVSVARNSGMAAASGEYITFVDADDEILPNAVEAFVKAVSNDCADMAVGRLLHVRSDGREMPEDRTEIAPLLRGNDFLEAVLADHSVGYYSCRILYRKAFIDGLNFPVGRIVGEDSYFVFCCALRKPTVVVMEEPVYKYHANMTSSTHNTFSQKKYEDVLHLLNAKTALLNEKYSQYEKLTNNLNLKIHMMLLANFCHTEGRQWKKAEKYSLEQFRQNRKYFIPASNQNVRWFRILSMHLYYPYKLFIRVKMTVRKILR